MHTTARINWTYTASTGTAASAADAAVSLGALLLPTRWGRCCCLLTGGATAAKLSWVRCCCLHAGGAAAANSQGSLSCHSLGALLLPTRWGR